jgi:hypothetical protein
MDDARNPSEQGQKDAEKETGDSAGQKHGERRQDYAKEISQRFHLRFDLFEACLPRRSLDEGGLDVFFRFPTVDF